MDSFDLRWPTTQALLYTDGIHLKIVVRDKRGPSGTISNVELCKDRIAIGLPFAPGLLSELQARGYRDLAHDIAQRADAVATPPAPADAVGVWLDQLQGSDAYAPSGTKRAKTWHPIAANLLLKVPAAKGKQEWVLKTINAGEKPEYLVAERFKGICAALYARSTADSGANEKFFAGLLSQCADFADEHADLQAAVSAWQKH